MFLCEFKLEYNLLWKKHVKSVQITSHIYQNYTFCSKFYKSFFLDILKLYILFQIFIRVLVLMKNKEEKIIFKK
jgi:hypothetical protein